MDTVSPTRVRAILLHWNDAPEVEEVFWDPSEQTLNDFLGGKLHGVPPTENEEQAIKIDSSYHLIGHLLKMTALPTQTAGTLCHSFRVHAPEECILTCECYLPLKWM